MPEGEALEPTALHRVLQLLAFVGLLEAIDRLHVVEHEWQVEQAELLGEFFELGQRWRRHLDIAGQHRLEHLIVVIELGAREDLDAGLAIHLLVHPLFKKRGGNALGVLVRVGDVAELDDDLAVLAGRERGVGREGECCRDSKNRKKSHIYLPSNVIVRFGTIAFAASRQKRSFVHHSRTLDAAAHVESLKRKLHHSRSPHIDTNQLCPRPPTHSHVCFA